MNKMYINLLNCHGIKRLSYNFDFQKTFKLFDICLKRNDENFIHKNI